MSASNVERIADALEFIGIQLRDISVALNSPQAWPIEIHGGDLCISDDGRR